METINEAAKDHAWKLRREINDMGGEKADVAHEAFLAAVAWAERWIPITEGYPEPYLIILVRGTIIHSSGVDIHITTCAWLAYDDDMKPIFTIQGSNEIINNVTHWRPIEHK